MNERDQHIDQLIDGLINFSHQLTEREAARLLLSAPNEEHCVQHLIAKGFDPAIAERASELARLTWRLRLDRSDPDATVNRLRELLRELNGAQ